jgi:hypothetical protein
VTTNLDIIKRAMNKIHVLAGGAEPTAVQAAAALDNLQSLYVELIGTGSLGRLYDVLATASLTAKEWSRNRASAGVTITLPITITQADAAAYPYGNWYGAGYGGPDYGWFYDNYGSVYPRPPMNLAPVVTVGASYNVSPDGGTTTIAQTGEVMWIWSPYQNAWTKLTNVVQQDAFPLASHFVNGFAAMLAERIVDDFDGQEVGAETKHQANGCRTMLSSGFDSYQRPAASCYF